MVKAEAALRKEAEEVQCLEKDGHYELALARVDELAARHAGSALVLHLAGSTHHAAASGASAASDEVAAAHHAAAAERYLAEAKRLVPNCVGISALLARVLFERGEMDEAYQEASRAIRIRNPADPADNNVVYTVNAREKNQRVERCRESARDVLRSIVASSVREVLDLDTDQSEGMTLAIEKATELANRRPYSSRAQLLCAYMKLQFARGLDATMDRRPILDPIRCDMSEAAKCFDRSLVLAMFHAKLCFVLGLYEPALRECHRAFSLRQPVDPKLEDVPPGSINGGVYDDRLSSIYQDLLRLEQRLLLVAKARWCLMTSEKQDRFLSVRLDELHKYCDEICEDVHWDTRTISDALTCVKKTGSWRFWICPYCIDKKLPDTHSLLEHMCNKHVSETDLRSVLHLDPKLSDEASVDDNSLDEISVCHDSDDQYLFHFNKTDNILDRLFCSTSSIAEARPFAEIQEERCREGKEILQKLKQKLKNLPKNKLSAEFDKARLEIQGLLHDFLVISALDYRIVILTLMKSFLWTKLLKSLSEDNATSKSIDNDDINSIFPEVAVVCVIRVEDRRSGAMVNKKMPASYINMAEYRNKIAQKLGRFEKDICSIIASGTTGRKYRPAKAIESTASNQLGDKPGSCSHSSEETPSMLNYRRSSFVLYQEQDDIFSLHSIIQILWNLRPFRDDFLKRQPVCSQSCHDAPCIAQILYIIFSAWEKKYYQKISYPLISLRNAICQVLSCSNSFQNVGENISYIVATILSRLHMPNVFMHNFSKLLIDGNTGELVSQPVNPAKVICTKQISCGCQTCLGVKEFTASSNKLDADSLQTAKVKSSAEDKCEQSGLKDIDLSFLYGTVFSTLVCYCSSERETQDMLRKVFDSIIDDPGFELYCPNPYVYSTTEDTMKCTVVSMVFRGR